MGLFKKEIVVKPTSAMTKAQVFTAAQSVVNSFQNISTNKKVEGGFIDYFFADIYDGRNDNLYRIFSDACESIYGLTKTDGFLVYTLIDNENNSTIDPGTLPGGSGGDTGNNGNVEDPLYERDYPIELEYSHVSLNPVTWEDDSFERKSIGIDELVNGTLASLQEVHGSDFTLTNIKAFIRLSANTFEKARYMPIYKTDTLEYIPIPTMAPGSVPFESDITYQQSVSDVAGLLVNGVTGRYLDSSTTAKKVAAANILRKIVDPTVFNTYYLLKINGQFLMNFTKDEISTKKIRRYVYITNNSMNSSTALTTDTTGPLIAKAGSSSATYVDGEFGTATDFTAVLAGAYMVRYVQGYLYNPDIINNIPVETKNRVKYFLVNTSKAVDFFNPKVIKDSIIEYLNQNVPNWADEFNISNFDDINYEVFNDEPLVKYVKHRYNTIVNNFRYVVDLQTNEILIAAVNQTAINPTIAVTIFAKTGVKFKDVITMTAKNTAPTIVINNIKNGVFAKEDVTLLDNPIKVINYARDVITTTATLG